MDCECQLLSKGQRRQTRKKCKENAVRDKRVEFTQMTQEMLASVLNM